MGSAEVSGEASVEVRTGAAAWVANGGGRECIDAFQEYSGALLGFFGLALLSGEGEAFSCRRALCLSAFQLE